MKNIKLAKSLADKQLRMLNEGIDSADMVGFEDKTTGQWIINPWYDSTCREELTDEQAVREYGLQNVVNFIDGVIEKFAEYEEDCELDKAKKICRMK